MNLSSSRCLCYLLFNLCLSSLQTALAQPGAAVAPFVDDQTLVVARIDLRQLDPTALVATLGKLAPPDDARFAQQLAGLEQKSKQLLAALTQLGVQEMYAVVSLADSPKEPLFVVAPLTAGGESRQAADGLRQLLRFEAADARLGVAVVGKSATIERLKTLQPAARPDFARGFERAGNAALQVVVAPSDDTRRVLREMLPRLPDEIGGGSGKTLADGVQWATLSVEAPPRLSLSVVIQSRDAEAATALRGTIVSGLQFLARMPDLRQRWPQRSHTRELYDART